MKRKRRNNQTASIVIAIIAIIWLIASLPKEILVAIITTAILLSIIIILLKKPEVKGFIGEFIVSRAIAKTSTDGKEQYIINNLILKGETGRTSQIDHIIINQNGVYVIETKNYTGTIYGEEWDFNWIQELNNGNRYEFYNPVKQNQTHINIVQKTIKIQVPIYSIIIFVRGNISNINSNKVYKLNSFTENIMTRETIKISIKEVRYIYDILKNYKDNPIATIKEHINNINIRN